MLDAGRVGACLAAGHARGRAVDRHLGRERADAAVVAAVEHRAPLVAIARDLDDGDAMRCHLDIDQLRRHVLEAGKVLPLLEPREHELFVGVFVIDAEQRRDRSLSSSGKNAT